MAREEGERRETATILVSDVVGSTDLRTRIGDTRANELAVAHEHMVGDIVDSHGGTLVKGLGDGALASFLGAADAATAAEAIQVGVARQNRRSPDDERIEIRVGLSAGDVTWVDDDCHGTPVVTAARLCSAAAGSQILCDDLVRGLARGQTELTFRLTGELELQGLPEPVVAYELAWQLTDNDTPPIPAPLLAPAGVLPFAGRAAEFGILQDAWKECSSGGPRIMLLHGEPGIGKTRLAIQTARQAHDDGASVLIGRCDESLQAPFGPWIEALRHLVAHADESVLRAHVSAHAGEALRVVPELRSRIPDVPDSRSTDAETERLLLFEAVTDLIGIVAQDTSCLLVLDDIHWADQASLRLLHHMVRHLPVSTRLMILITYRDTDIDRSHPAQASLADLRREPMATWVAVRGFDEFGVQQLLEEAGGHPLADEALALARVLTQQTEGNPFFLGEVIRHLVETGAVVHDGERWVGTVPLAEAGIPEGVRDVIGRRLSRLSDEANEALRTAAVIGREFNPSLLAELLEVSFNEASDAVEEALSARLLDDVGDRIGSLSFSHALVRTTLLEELSTNRRIRLHARVGEVLEGHSDPDIATLAYHFGEAAIAGESERAVRYATEAALAARRTAAYEDALALHQKAVEVHELSGQADPAQRSELLTNLAFVEHILKDEDTARGHALEAAECGRRAGSGELVASAGGAYIGVLGHWADLADPVGVELLREGLLAMPEEDSVQRAELMARISYALAPVAVDDEAMQWAQSAATMARRLNDDDALNFALGASGWAFRGEPVSQFLPACVEGVEVATRVNNAEWIVGAQYCLGNAQLRAGNMKAADEAYDVASTARSPLQGWATKMLETTLALADGRFDEHAALLEEVQTLGAALGQTMNGIAAGHRSVSAIFRGAFDEARQAVADSAENLIAIAFPNEARLEATVGDLEAAEVLMSGWEDSIRPHIPRMFRYFIRSYEADIIDLIGDETRAARLLSELEPFSGELLANDPSFYGAADFSIGRLQSLVGDHDAAVHSLESALDAHEKFGVRVWTTDTHLSLGIALQRRTADGDGERARLELTRAQSMADEIGLVPMAARAAAALAS